MINDFELIYLIQSEQQEHLFLYMEEKYEKLIWKHIHMLCYQKNEFDDYYQEGLQVLYKVIQKFDPSKNKTFTRYFELVLKRRYYDLNKVHKKWILFDDVQFDLAFASYDIYVEEAEQIPVIELKPLDQMVYEQYFIKKQKIKDISIQLKLNRKKVYNIIYKIREKHKNVLK